MSKPRLPLLVLTLAAICMPAMAGEKVVKRVPAGAVAFHFVFDLAFPQEEGELPEFVGYVAFIEGVDGDSNGDLFDGSPSQATAYFTVRVTAPLPQPASLPVPDADMNAFLYAPGGQFTVFFNPDPNDFSEGEAIAVFEESALLSTEANGTFPGVFLNTFSSRLIDSTPIHFNGQRINFRKLVPNGVTITNFGILISAAAVAVAVQIGWHIVYPETPLVEPMGLVAVLNLGANSLCLWLLSPHRRSDVNMESVWECSRNDVVEGFAVIGAALAVWIFESGWPDILVAIVLLAVFSRSAIRVLTRALRELGPAAT